MAELGALANVVGLASAAIKIVQQLCIAYEAVKNLPENLKHNSKLLKELLVTLQFVKDTEALRKPIIADQIQSVTQAAKEITGYIESTSHRFRKSRIVQRYLQILITGPTAEQELSAQLFRLHSARDQLLLRIQIVDVSLAEDIKSQLQSVLVIMESSRKNSDFYDDLRSKSTKRQQGAKDQHHPVWDGLQQNNRHGAAVRRDSQPNYNPERNYHPKESHTAHNQQARSGQEYPQQRQQRPPSQPSYGTQQRSAFNDERQRFTGQKNLYVGTKVDNSHVEQGNLFTNTHNLDPSKVTSKAWNDTEFTNRASGRQGDTYE